MENHNVTISINLSLKSEKEVEELKKQLGVASNAVISMKGLALVVNYFKPGPLFVDKYFINLDSGTRVDKIIISQKQENPEIKIESKPCPTQPPI